MKRALSVIFLLVVGLAMAHWLGLLDPFVGRKGTRGAVRVKSREESSSAPRLAAPIDAYADRAQFQLAVYFLPKSSQPPRPLLELLLPRYRALRLAGRAGKDDGTISIADIAIENFRPPSLDMLEHCGRGVSPEQAMSVQKAAEVFVLDFAYRPVDGFAVLRQGHELLLDLARETGGLIWDDATRELFTPAAWKERRLDVWDRDLPDVSSQVTIHFYRNRDLFRAVTLGMGKLGLPDVVVNDAPASGFRPVANLINLTCQILAEKRKLDGPGRLHLDVAQLGNERLRTSFTASSEESASGKADFVLVVGRKEEGDADNRLIEIDFPAGKGLTATEAQQVLVSGLFGFTEKVAFVKHDEELLEASRKQRERLPQLAALFRKGLPPGERILLKAPFRTDQDGQEWMWVEVVVWRRGRIEGILQNDPSYVQGLIAGARVEFHESDVFDFLHYFRDGRSEGNETGKIMTRREGAPEPGEALAGKQGK